MQTKILNFFKRNAEGVSTFRLYLMRFIFLMTFFFLGKDAWTEIFTHKGTWDPLYGVAFSFWAAYSLLMIFGLRYPLKMLPLLFLQFSYKVIWLAAVSYPLLRANKLKGSAAEEMTTVFVIAVIIDILIIPWGFALKNYILKSGTKK